MPLPPEEDELHAAALTGRLFALLDACDVPGLAPKMWELGEGRAVSLYSGSAEEDYWSFAPYLAACDSELIDWIVAQLWTDPWGLFILSDGPLEALRKHFKRFLMVDDPAGQPMYFRFYDPRVLGKFLPTCSAKELGLLFGEVESFVFGDGAAGEANLAMTRKPAAWSPTPAWFGIGQRLRIGQEQMDVFEGEGQQALVNRMTEHLREHHAGEVEAYSDEDLAPMIRTGILKARRYGLERECDLTGFVALMFEIAPNFDEHSRMQGILASPSIAPERKLSILVDRTPEHIWSEAEARRDNSVWTDGDEVSA